MGNNKLKLKLKTKSSATAEERGCAFGLFSG